MPHISLDAKMSQLNGLRELPASLPVSNGAAAGPWSGVPLWRGLDSDFLCAPSIPKAPLAPRVKVEMVGQTLRIADDIESSGFALPSQQENRDVKRARSSAQGRMLLVFSLLGFVGGIVVAWLLGALR